MMTTATRHCSLLILFFSVFLVKKSTQHVVPKLQQKSCDSKGGDASCNEEDFSGYDAEFYDGALESEDGAKVFARKLANLMPPIASNMFADSGTSVVDVGCGAGQLVQNLRSFGVLTSYGLEGSPEASKFWPTNNKDDDTQYYHIVDLTTDAARKVMPVTDYVTTFEVAEHLQPEDADKFISLLTMFTPRRVIFGAATVFQDRGRNPTHVNEREFGYWIEKFKKEGYMIDLATTAKLRHDLITDNGFMKYFNKLWWFPKNILVFTSLDYTTKEELNTMRANLPPQVNMLDPAYTKLGYNSEDEFGTMWERDWTEFAELFHAKSPGNGYSGDLYDVYA